MQDDLQDEASEGASRQQRKPREEKSGWGPVAAIVAVVAIGGAKVGRKLLTRADDVGRAITKSADEVGTMASRQADEAAGVIRQSDEVGAPRFDIGQLEGVAEEAFGQGIEQVGSMAIDGWLDDEDSGDGPASDEARPLSASIEQLEQNERYAPRSIELPDGVREYELVERRSVARFRRERQDGTAFDETKTEADLPAADSGSFVRFRLSKRDDGVRCVRQLRMQLPSGEMTVSECIGDLTFAGAHTWADILLGEEEVALNFTAAGATSFAVGLGALCCTSAEAALGPSAQVEAAFVTEPSYSVTVGPRGVELALDTAWTVALSGSH